MCEGRLPALPRPRWARLHGILLVSATALFLIETRLSAPALRVTLESVTAALLFIAMAWWVRANRAALDLREWCACAGARVTVRVIESAPPCAAPLETVAGVLPERGDVIDERWREATAASGSPSRDSPASGATLRA